MAYSRSEIFLLFQKTANEVVERELPLIDEAMAINELGIDSLGMLEIIGSLERQLKVRIPDEELAGIQSVRELLEVVEKRQNS